MTILNIDIVVLECRLVFHLTINELKLRMKMYSGRNVVSMLLCYNTIEYNIGLMRLGRTEAIQAYKTSNQSVIVVSAISN